MNIKQHTHVQHPSSVTFTLLPRALWDRARNPYLSEGATPDFFERLLHDAMSLAKAINDEGGILLAGTDALSPMIVPGASMANELELLVEAGLSPYDALRSATRTPSEVLPQFADLGVVAPGRTANFILTRANPLEDIRAVRQPSAVVLAGSYFDRSRRQAGRNSWSVRSMKLLFILFAAWTLITAPAHAQALVPGGVVLRVAPPCITGLGTGDGRQMEAPRKLFFPTASNGDAARVLGPRGTHE